MSAVGQSANDLAASEDEHPVGAPGDKLDIMGAHRNRAPLAGQVAQDLAQRGLWRRVQSAGRLVQEQDRGRAVSWTGPRTRASSGPR
ncbi:MAG: hypothetical protein IPL94_08980 [Tetrasphaera sp.]|nr:hypothetical protein [Tetrasphaera sp.]